MRRTFAGSLHPGLFDEVTALMKGGLLRRYLEREEDCLAVRGSILLNRQLTTLANRTDLAACRYDELTADNHRNRLIKAGLRAVRPWIHGVALQRSWIELMAGFDEVTDIAEARPLLTGLRYDRQGWSLPDPQSSGSNGSSPAIAGPSRGLKTRPGPAF